MRRAGIRVVNGTADEGLTMLLRITEQVKDTTTRGSHPLQPERNLKPSRERFFKQQRINRSLWANWARKTKQLALAPRLYGVGTDPTRHLFSFFKYIEIYFKKIKSYFLE